MKGILGFVKTTVIGGLLVILPMAVIVILVAHVLRVAHEALKPIASGISDSIYFPYVAAALLVILVCFLAGLIFSTSPGRKLGALLERYLYERVPGYNMLKALGGRALTHGADHAMQPAFVELEEALVPAFVMERHADGGATVFVPSSPTPTVGSLYVLPASRVHPIDVPMAKFMGCLSGWGVGTKDLLPAIRRET
ncbi:MAG: DUF502 domain-containing protein [Dongiaceae bacterium]